MRYLDEVCLKILSVDNSIRFVGIVDIEGNIMTTKYRSGLVPLLSKQETAQSISHSVMRMRTRRQLEAKLGRTIYVISFYEKVKRIAMPIGKTGEYILIMSLDINSDHGIIIRDRIMPLLEPYASVSDDYIV